MDREGREKMGSPATGKTPAAVALKFDIGGLLVVSGDAGVDDGDQRVGATPGMWSMRSRASWNGDEVRLEVLRASARFWRACSRCTGHGRRHGEGHRDVHR
jgi:hypothetical protein